METALPGRRKRLLGVYLPGGTFPPQPPGYILPVMLSEESKGVFIASVTPFSDTGAIDYRSVDSLMNFYLEKAVHGITILVGNGGRFLPQELRRGADGAMTGFAYPEMLVQVYERFCSENADGAEDAFNLYLPLEYEDTKSFDELNAPGSCPT